MKYVYTAVVLGALAAIVVPTAIQVQVRLSYRRFIREEERSRSRA